jgi:hypothetical protein
LMSVSRAALMTLAAFAMPAASSLATPADAAEAARLGKTSVGASVQGLAAERKHVNGYRLPVAGKITQLSVYLEPTSVVGQQQIEGMIYSEGQNEPEMLLNVSYPLTFTSGQAAGWYTLSFPVTSELPAGNYWLGVIASGPEGVAAYRYDTVTGSGAADANAFAFGPANPFGEVLQDNQQVSLYASYSAESAPPAPESTSPPSISGAAEKGQQLTAAPGSWSGSPTAYAYEWLRCNAAGASCGAISGATSSTYTLGETDVGSTLRAAVAASNEAGSSAPVNSAPSAVVTAGLLPPHDVSPPTISGTAQQGATLTESAGHWTGEPTRYSYQWVDCDALGESCLPISGATANTYTLNPGDVGHTVTVQETASNAAGAGEAATAAATKVVAPARPTDTAPPTISGTAQQGATLTESHGHWTGEPTGYSYQWMQCEASGNGCQAISGASGQSYVPTSGDVGHAIKVSEIASNAGGSSSPALSAPTAAIVAPGTTATFGVTTVGTRHDGGMYANYKIVHRATLGAAGSVTKLTMYAIPGHKSPSPQALKAVIYADSGGAPGALLATGTEVTYNGAANGTGWFDLPLPSPVSLSAGTYWIGFITGTSNEGVGYAYESVAGSRAYNANSFASGPTNPFGTATTDAEQASIYATYTPSSGPSIPHNSAPPTIAGNTQQGQQLTAAPGSWSGSPTAFTYEWLRCNAAGASCSAISGATSSTYTLGEADVGSTLRVAVEASNEAGESEPVNSAQTAAVSTNSGVSHLEYVLDDGVISVYDIDHGFALAKTISLPQTKTGIRGVSVCPASHRMFISFGGDGGPFGNGSVLAYDLVSEKVVWEAHLGTGVDSGDVSPDCKKLYEPTGENSSGGVWNVLNAENGELTGAIQGASAPHNTIASPDGKYVYLGGRQHDLLDVYETETGKVFEVGAPTLVGSVRPFTVNGSDTLAYTTATSFAGFQVSSIATRKLLFTVSFGEIPSGFPATTGSHGISLSPDEKQLYVVDAVHKEVQFYDVSKVGEGVAPAQLGVVPVAGLTGEESGCAYDCLRDGWIQLSTDGRFAFVGDSGDVIETATRNVIAHLPTLENTRKSIEVDWQNGVPVATSGRSGVGKVG